MFSSVLPLKLRATHCFLSDLIVSIVEHNNIESIKVLRHVPEKLNITLDFMEKKRWEKRWEGKFSHSYHTRTS